MRRLGEPPERFRGSLSDRTVAVNFVQQRPSREAFVGYAGMARLSCSGKAVNVWIKGADDRAAQGSAAGGRGCRGVPRRRRHENCQAGPGSVTIGADGLQGGFMVRLGRKRAAISWPGFGYGEETMREAGFEPANSYETRP